ncbi:MAG TPA: hypothetical protein VK943_13155 [Arenibaculum sp.]|nr:hypothetical protein [Arenibaculum sp.]
MRGWASWSRRMALAVGTAVGLTALSGCAATMWSAPYPGPLQVPGGYVYGVEPPRIVIQPRPRAYHAVPGPHHAHPPPWPGIGRPGYDGRDRDWRGRDWRGRHRPPPGFGIGRPYWAPGWGPGWGPGRPWARSPLRDNGRCDDRRYETSSGGRAAPGTDEYDCSRFGGGLKGKYR